MKKIFILLMILLAFTPNAFGQPPSGVATFQYGSEAMAHLKFPQSPEATAFQKYGSIPVTLHTGTPNISVPLPSIKGRELDIPISIGYDATGVKVDQLATFVGLNWNLNFGGRITRIVNGQPDDLVDTVQQELDWGTYYEFHTPDGLMLSSTAEVDTYFALWKGLSDGCREMLSDFYSINVMDLNDYSDGGSTLINPRIRITYTPGVGQVVIAEDGTQYIFGYTNGYVEKTTIEGTDDPQSNTCVRNAGTSDTSWLLKKIISKNGLDVYEFSYKEFVWQQNLVPLQTVSSITNSQNEGSIGVGTPFYDQDVYQYNFHGGYHTTQLMPDKLIHNGKLVLSFTYKNRIDLLFGGTGEGNALNEIIYYKYNTSPTNPTASDVLKKVYFIHSYFGSFTGGNHLNKRLKLDHLIIYNGISNGPNDSQTYSFDYFNPSGVPPVGFKGQDFLGLNNGANNSHLVPSASGITGANRSFNFDQAINGTLSKITYPTKGHTCFEFEPHTAKPSNPYPEQVEQVVGGAGAGYIHYNDRPEWIHPYMSEATGVNTNEMIIYESDNYYIETTPGVIYMISRPKCLDNTPSSTYRQNVPSGPVANAVPVCGSWTNFHPTELYTHHYPDFPAQYANGIYQYSDRLLWIPAGVYQITAWNTGAEGSSAGVSVYRRVHQYPNNDATVQGFRIKSISNYTAEGHTEQNPNINLSSKKIFRYTDTPTTPISSGYRLVYEPNYTSYTSDVLKQGQIRQKRHIIRNSQGYASSPNVAYTNVFEYDSNGITTNGYTEHIFAKETSGGIVSEGNFSSFKKPVLGREIATKIFDASEKLKQHTIFTYQDTKIYEYLAGISASVDYTMADQLYCHSIPFGTSNIVMEYHSQEKYTWQNQEILGIPKSFFNPYHSNYWGNTIAPGSFHKEEVLGKNAYVKKESRIEVWNRNLIRKNTITYFDDTTTNFVEDVETYKYNTSYPYMLSESTKSTEGTGTSPQTTITNGLRTKYTYMTDPNFNRNPEKITHLDQYKLTNGSEELLTARENVYGDFGTTKFVTSVITSKAGGTSENRIFFDYDPASLNILQNKKPGNNPNSDVYECYVFAYNNMLPVAKISGAKYSDIDPNKISAVRIKTDVANPDMVLVKNELDLLRASLPNAQVTTYTYNPGVGMTSITDPKGETKYYTYDALGRLISVKDTDSSILSTTLYHYRP
ncbi:RHS repeat domain-containing protein [Flavobacterium sp.]|uniref:RHS repeat protein n=1 Tax=Flavobacterium sp. TaxID=239 RepID=UPI0039E4DBE9